MDPAQNQNTVNNPDQQGQLPASPGPDQTPPASNNPTPPAEPASSLATQQTPNNPVIDDQPAENPLPPIPPTGPITQSYISSPKNIAPPSAPPAPPAEPQKGSKVAFHKNIKLPFMIVTVILLVISCGFTISFFVFKNSKTPSNKSASTNITPRVSQAPKPTLHPTEPITDTNPFTAPSASADNPFVQTSANYENPFGIYDNPFASATASSQIANQPYENPFDNME